MLFFMKPILLIFICGIYANYQYIRQYNSNFLLIGMKKWSNINIHIAMGDIASGWGIFIKKEEHPTIQEVLLF